MLLKNGSKSDDVKRLQSGLTALGFACGTTDGVFGQKTEDAVESFQDKNNLYVDGSAGSATIAKYNSLAPAEFRIAVPAAKPVTQPTTKIGLVSVDCDSKFGGFSHTKLRADVAAKFTQLRAECVALGGGVTTAGGVRALTAGGGSAQSSTSLHYPAIALDLALDSGMNRPDSLYVCTKTANPRRFTVWMRCTADTVAQQTLKAVICSTRNGKTTLTEVPVTGRYIDFTALAKKYGFEGISCRKSFLTGGSYDGAEWWHMQCEAVLTPNVSTFGEELLKVYSESEIRASFHGDWDSLKDNVWQQDWF